MAVKHFVNLTDGVEWIPQLPQYTYVRMESTSIEKKNWTLLMRDLDVHFLMSLAVGHECHLYDCGTRRETSKTVSVGVPYVRKRLHAIWIDAIDFPAPTRDEQDLKRKLHYFRRYLNTTEIKLIGHSVSTDNDGNVSFYRNLVLKSENQA